MKNNFIKFFTLIIAIIISISCGNEITPPENDNDNKFGKVIVVDADKTYTVRIGSIITNIKPSDMTNAWKNYIGGKKVLKPDKTDAGWYFDKETGNYHEPTFSTSSPRANLVGAVIMSNHGEAYLMGMYYNNKILGAGFSQYMLIYIQADGQERGYYGGGSDKNKKPDYSTVWTHYQASLGVDPLGILADNGISKDPDPEPEPTYEHAIAGNKTYDFNLDGKSSPYTYFRMHCRNKKIKDTKYFFDSVGNSVYNGNYNNQYFYPKTAFYLTNDKNVYLAGVYYPITNNNSGVRMNTYIAFCIETNYNLLVFSSSGHPDPNLSKQEQFYKLTWKKLDNVNYSLVDKNSK